MNAARDWRAFSGAATRSTLAATTHRSKSDAVGRQNELNKEG
jgi:hypothetical protein